MQTVGRQRGSEASVAEQEGEGDVIHDSAQKSRCSGKGMQFAMHAGNEVRKKEGKKERKKERKKEKGKKGTLILRMEGK